jgi:hypothetical protein
MAPTFHEGLGEITPPNGFRGTFLSCDRKKHPLTRVFLYGQDWGGKPIQVGRLLGQAKRGDLVGDRGEHTAELSTIFCKKILVQT